MASNNNISNLVNFRLIFRALHSRNYRLFFCGQSVSLVGTWMQQIAMSWLVYRITNSAILLGVVAFTSQIPTFLFSPFAGVIADRHRRHRILVATQILSMVQALLLAFLVLSQTIQVWHIISLSLLLGLVNAFDIPVRHAFTIEMIEKKEDLSNAIALNSSMVNLARLIGPSLAGVIIAVVGEGLCFLLNGISYVAVIVSLFLMKIPRQHKKVSTKPVLHDLWEGFVYAFTFAPIRTILILLSMVSLMGVPYQILMPIFARDVFHGNSVTLGALMAMSGVGALFGAIYLAARKSVLGLCQVMIAMSALFGLGVAAFAFSRVLWLSMAILGVVGFAMMVQMASCNTLLQTIADEDKRGRVMSFYTVAFMGMAPFGSLIAGGLAHRIGAPYTLLLGGVCCVVGAALFSRQVPAFKEKVYPIYVKRGIIPPGTTPRAGCESSSEK